MKKLTKTALAVTMVCTISLFHTQKANAQIPIVSIITSAIKKVIVALDLQVQRLQNKTIALQNAEANLENSMSLGNLNDISGWLNKEKNLYSQYYQELQTVKHAISDYEEVKRAVVQQEELVKEYKTAYSLFRQDNHFSATELSNMAAVYNGILQASARNLDEVVLAVTNFNTQMSDAERLATVHKADAGLQNNLNDLRQFNNNAMRLSLQRAQDKADAETVKRMYGLQ